MEKEKLFLNEGANSTAAVPIWNPCSFGMEMQSNKLNCCSDQLPNCFFNPNWDSSMDQSDPFASALSSIVSSPVTTSNAIPSSGGVGDPVMIRELIGRLGNICNSGEISYINNNSSTNTSCYSTPLNSPPKLNISIMDSQIIGNLPILGNGIPDHQSLAPFLADPGFAERAARYSCFGSRNLASNESELSHRLMPRLEPDKLQRVSSNPSEKATGRQANVNVDGNSNSDKKFSRLSRSSTPENAEFGDSRDESSVSEKIPGGKLSMKGLNDSNSRKRKAIPKGKAKETPSSSLSASDSKVVAEMDESKAKRSKSKEINGDEKDSTKANEEENSNQKQNKDNSKPPEPLKDYIHVRARRGQATDSHSLAERVRREKISERMKFLQDLVPGCSKVTGKAVMLDEIINYVQSLQRQVEFLSMKLATVNPRMDISMEALLSKDIFQSRGSLSQNLYPLENSAALSFPYGYRSQQGIALPNGMFSNGETQFSTNPLNAVLKRNQCMQLPALDGFGDAPRQVSTFWEDDLQSVVQMGFGQNQLQQPQAFHDSNMPGAQMKVEL
ncbi:hypothetical protein P3X46_002547 [Hevea brasiliensis]|uniref:BHLH domain-containing protein n=1 Tax=Hevea brasiliensis TaxID=3981 RepID=A0ABQ9N3B9_HEVBR|nr:transcription factor bHLH77 isoform X2 [Hevea brasiliensis]KAJ9187051.1 hypothetical protein P3X46_002547 [Hevea brasiliensis]